MNRRNFLRKVPGGLLALLVAPLAARQLLAKELAPVEAQAEPGEIFTDGFEDIPEAVADEGGAAGWMEKYRSDPKEILKLRRQVAQQIIDAGLDENGFEERLLELLSDAEKNLKDGYEPYWRARDRAYRNEFASWKATQDEGIRQLQERVRATKPILDPESLRYRKILDDLYDPEKIRDYAMKPLIEPERGSFGGFKFYTTDGTTTTPSLSGTGVWPRVVTNECVPAGEAYLMAGGTTMTPTIAVGNATDAAKFKPLHVKAIDFAAAGAESKTVRWDRGTYWHWDPKG